MLKNKFQISKELGDFCRSTHLNKSCVYQLILNRSDISLYDNRLLRDVATNVRDFNDSVFMFDLLEEL